MAVYPGEWIPSSVCELGRQDWALTVHEAGDPIRSARLLCGSKQYLPGIGALSSLKSVWFDLRVVADEGEFCSFLEKRKLVLDEASFMICCFLGSIYDCSPCSAVNYSFSTTCVDFAS